MAATTCDRCGQYLAPGMGMVAIGVLCPRCYMDDPYGEEGRKPKRVRPAPYSTKKVWGIASAPRNRALLHRAPVLTADGVPWPKGAKLTERDGVCWQCKAPVGVGQAEAVWVAQLRGQRAVCSTCTWLGIYALMLPGITREQAAGMAALGLPLATLDLARRAGYDVDEVLAGILTPEVIAGLPVAASLAAGARS